VITVRTDTAASSDRIYADLGFNRSLKETLAETQRSVDDFKQKQWRVNGGKPFAEIAGRIGQFTQIIAPIVEATPFGAPVVWGAFNMLLKVRRIMLNSS